MNMTTQAEALGISPQDLHPTIGGAYFGFTLGTMYDILSVIEDGSLGLILSTLQVIRNYNTTSLSILYY